MKWDRQNTLILSVAAVLSVAVLVINKKESPQLTSHVFHGISGWGYEILVNDKLFIRQESIPVIRGDRGFLKKEQAEKTAELIINKMKGGQPPTVTIFELRQTGALNDIENGQRKHQ